LKLRWQHPIYAGETTTLEYRFKLVNGVKTRTIK